jgi:PAS domain S-box-containing protein
MKIKINLPAMNKNLFFGFGFVLFTSLVLLINWLFSLPVKQADRINRQLMRTEQQIQLLKSMQNQFILSFEKSDGLFSDEKGWTQQEINATISSIRQDIEFYDNFRPFARHKEVAASLKELVASLNTYQGNLNDFMLAYVERGSENTGLIFRWREISSRMLTASQKNGPEVAGMMEKIGQLENSYLLHNDPKVTENITAIAGELQQKLTTKEGGINPSDPGAYMTLTADLTALNKRMGSSETQGIVSNTRKSLETLLSSSDMANRLMNDTIGGIRTKWTIIRFPVIALFTLACIILLILISLLEITRPLTSAAHFLQKMTSGELPKETLDPEGLPEIRKIDKELNAMIKGLKEKADFARSLNENNLNVGLTLSGPDDILGRELGSLQLKMKETADLQAKNDEENAKRRYINEGLARFGEILRSQSNDIHLLGDAFIREIVKYLNAIQGGFFLLNDTQKDDKELELISAFAYNRKKYLQKSLSLGEGLVGTCAKEKQIINLTEIPEDYITITSGLGDTKPDNLLLVPVLHENELIGVLEIASLHRYKEHEIQFAGEVAGSLGATIIYARNNQRTSELLAKSQQQALEMAEQEEEMRQNMEELKATQEESERREEEFRGIAEAIGHSLFMVEYGLDGIIRNANDKFCIFFGCTREEITGKSHQEILDGTLKPDAAFWDELQRTSQVTLVEKVKIGRKHHLLKEHFASVKNRDGIVIQYINFITEMTS